MHYKLHVRDVHRDAQRGLIALLCLFILSTAVFAWLALRNARMINCQDIVKDPHGQLVCEIGVNPDGSVKVYQ